MVDNKDDDKDGVTDQAKRGVKDKGKMVTGALGEPLIGTIADVTDEDE